ncbi:transglycosylase SLT domain-containing protein [Candidatus Roizmanbacteria bacterium]|nr:transglycosylase SLT domain-containing protein [Candidatus Roizmanbacteria bacterium]
MYFVGMIVSGGAIITSLLLLNAAYRTPVAEGEILSAVIAVITPTSTVTPTPTSTPTPTNTPTPAPSFTPTPTLPPTPTPVPVSATEIDGWFERYSRENNVEIATLRKIAVCESGYNTNSKSKHGYSGMFQFSESAWRTTRTNMGADSNPDLRFNPEESIKTAAWKIAHQGTAAWPACGR